MDLREATPEDNRELQELQANCPQGKTLIVSIVNTPDFFARAKAYESYKVFVVCDDHRIIGSAACGIRRAFIKGDICQVGYEFQYFTSPDYRGRGVAKQLHQQIKDHLIQQGTVLSYLLVMEGNLPAMRLFANLGFEHHRTLVMPALVIFKQMKAEHRGNLRHLKTEDFPATADLLNETWRDHELYEPTSPEALRKFLDRTPAYHLDNFWVLEDQDEIQACMGFWDWNQIMKITLKNRNLKMKILGFFLNLSRLFRPLPRIPKVGHTLKQWCITPMGFKDPKYLGILLRHFNNLAFQRGIEQIFTIGEKNHLLLRNMKGFTHVDTAMHLYVKPLQKNLRLGNAPVFVDGIDL